MAIQSFKDRRCERLLAELSPGKGFPADLIAVTLRKLIALNVAESLDDLHFPPGNRLEALKGERAGQHSIRVNRQFRICFVFTADGPTDVEFTDYH